MTCRTNPAAPSWFRFNHTFRKSVWLYRLNMVTLSMQLWSEEVCLTSLSFCFLWDWRLPCHYIWLLITVQYSAVQNESVLSKAPQSFFYLFFLCLFLRNIMFLHDSCHPHTQTLYSLHLQTKHSQEEDLLESVPGSAGTDVVFDFNRWTDCRIN